jgi:adenine specific DNA methylase Mod
LPEFAGKVALVYIDPPFDVGADFSFTIEVGDGEDLVKEPSVIEDVAYRDTWGRGADSYYSMLHERLLLIHGLMSADGMLYVHCDSRVGSGIKLILDEVFGSERFINEVVWKRSDAHNDVGQGARFFGKIHDTLYVFSKGDHCT